MNIIQQTYRNLRRDGHYFDSDTVKLFGSRILDIIQTKKKDYLFIDSIRNYNNTGRLYKVCIQSSKTGKIETISTFDSLYYARKFLNEQARKAIPFSYYKYANFIIDLLDDAAKLWEENGGNWTEDAAQKQDNAKYWGKQAGLIVQWDTFKGNVYDGKEEVTELLRYVASIVE